MPIVTTIFSVLGAPLDERDLVGASERRMLQRGYYSFLATLINNNVADVLANQGECVYFWRASTGRYVCVFVESLH